MENKYKRRFPIKPLPRNRSVLIWGIVFIFALLVLRLWHNQNIRTDHPSYPAFFKEMETKKIQKAVLIRNKLKGQYILSYKKGKNFVLTIPAEDKSVYQALRKNVPDFRVKYTSTFLSDILITIMPVLLIVVLLWFMLAVHVKNPRYRSMRLTKNRVRFASKNREKITFDDVAGVKEAKEELQEIIEFLKDPKRFQRLGGRIPKGVLLSGAPGTGKTLLAKAIAGEADVPFFSISGSDFVEMFVGVGASRVRDVFKRGKRNAPCIIFLDELDAVGRHREAETGSHGEREQTLNALLVEMDGFNTKEGVIVIAATNRPDILDPALLRAGRFDRRVDLGLPDLTGRIGILNVHLKNIVVGDDVVVEQIARGTAGFSGADLANLVNEAALFAARFNKSVVEMSDFYESRDKIRWGKEDRSRVMDEDDRRITAYHEAGHTLVFYLIPETEPLHKVSIIPRGIALGATMQLSEKDRYTQTKKQLLGKIAGLMGGRIAEEVIFDDVSTGASDDIRQATEIAKRMVCEWGMSSKLGLLWFGGKEVNSFSNKTRFKVGVSEARAVEIDSEIKKIIDTCYKKAKDIVVSNKEVLREIAESLLYKEVLEKCDIDRIIRDGIERHKNVS